MVLVATGTALIFAYLVTEIQVRLFFGNNFALFMVAFIALFVAYLLGYTRGRSGRRRRKRRHHATHQGEESH